MEKIQIEEGMDIQVQETITTTNRHNLRGTGHITVKLSKI